MGSNGEVTRIVLRVIGQPKFSYVIISRVSDVKVTHTVEGQPVGSRKESRGKLGEVFSCRAEDLHAGAVDLGDIEVAVPVEGDAGRHSKLTPVISLNAPLSQEFSITVKWGKNTHKRC